MLAATRLLGVLCLLALAGCASLAGPRDIALPLPKLQASLERRFPLRQRALDVFEITLSRPRLALLADSGRVALTLDAEVAPPFTRQTWRGSLALSGRLALDPARQAVMLAEPAVDSFVVDGVEAGRQRQLLAVANGMMALLIVDVPVYHFRPEELRVAGVQFVPVRITTSAQGLLVTLAPAR